MPSLPHLLCLSLLALAFGACKQRDPAVAVPAYDLAIASVTPVDAVSGTRDPQTVLLRDGRIVALVPPTTPLEDDKRRIDGSGRFLIPGLWDLHVHITYEPALADTFAAQLLDYGITSVRDTGGVLPALLPAVERWRSSTEPTPHLYFGGPLLDGRLVVYDGAARPLIGVGHRGAEAARARVAELKAVGASFIKIYEMVEDEVFDALVAAAAEAQLPIAAHVPLAVDPLRAGPALASLEHLRNLDLACADEAETMLAERRARIQDTADGGGFELRRAMHQEQRTRAYAGVAVDSKRCRAVQDAFSNTVHVPTLRLNTISRFSPAARADWQEALSALPTSLAERWLSQARSFQGRGTELALRYSEWSLTLTRALADRGAPIGAGTDTPIAQAIPGYALHTELERLVDAGLTPRQALAAATVAPARFFRWPPEREGRVAVGHPADLLLLDANPLDAIKNTRSISAVVLRGELVRTRGP